MSENPKTRPAIAIQTSSEHFTNGEILELVRDPDDSGRLALLHKNAHRIKLVPQLQYSGQTYVPALLNSRLLSQLRLPETAEAYGSAAKLSDEICNLVVKYCGVGEELGFLVSCFAIATFFSDCLSCSPCLVIFGAAEEAETLLRVLAWMCWRPLLLTDSKVSAGAPSSYPPDSSDLFEARNSKPTTTSTVVGFHVLQSGRFTSVFRSMRRVSGEP